MNKIYLEPIAKTEALARGVKSQADVLVRKGICIDADRLSAACCALEQAGRAQDAAEATLKEAREAAHARLNELKELFNATKVPIKQGFAPEMWNVFGFMDRK